MKKFFVSISLSVALCLPAVAGVVSPRNASDLAEAFFGGSNLTLSAGSVSTKASSDYPFYVFNREGGGYVIISGEDSISPVIAYSETGSFSVNEISPAFRAWLENVEKGIEYNRANGAEVTPEIARMWRQVAAYSATKAAGDQHMVRNASTGMVGTPEWKQSSPYNSKCPLLLGQYTVVTGCVPLALSEVMYYYRWPDTYYGTGPIPSYTVTYDGTPQTFGGYTPGTYNYGNMDTMYQLITDVGQALQVIYNGTSSSASGKKIVSVAGEYFRYNKGAVILNRESYDATEWYSMICAEIDANRPVIVDAFSGSGGGHCFIFDGYTESVLDLVHVNWGWGSSMNEWVSLGAEYYGDQAAIFGFEPDRSGVSSESETSLIITGGNNFTFSAPPVQGNTFSVTVSCINNAGAYPYTGHIRVVHLDKNGSFVENLSTNITSCTSLAPGSRYTSVTFNNCRINSPIEFGDCISVYHRPSGSSTWRPLKPSINGAAIPSYPLVPRTFIDAKASYNVGEFFYFRLKNTPMSYMYSSNGGSAYLSRWTIYRNGSLVKVCDKWSIDRYVQLDSAGEWMILCELFDGNFSAPVETVMTKFTVE